ncbi:glycosyltransferase family 4 protein [Alphaproteobacteria bacterium]|nr:glycosyltransferase family 4 protein [Alphaproteobacteria bacterium]
MKILHCFILFSIEVGGGTPEFIYQICKGQAKAGLKPTVLSGSYAFDEVLANKLDGVDFHVEKTYLHKQGFSLMPGLILWCRNNLQQYDVVHMHAYRTFQNLVLYYYCRKYNIPYIIDSHGSAPYGLRKVFLKKIYDYFFGKKMLKESAFIFAECQKGVEEYKNIIPDLSDCSLRVVYPSFDLEKFANLPVKGLFRKSQGLSFETSIVLFVGRLAPIKGLEFLIKSFAKFVSNSPNSKLYLVGEDGGTGYKKSLVNLVEQYQLQDLVIFPGFLAGHDKLSAIIDASVLVQSSWQEQGPRVPFDAVLLGTPVIVTANTGSGELVELFDAGEIVQYNNTEQLSQKLYNVIKNLEFAKKRTNNAAIKIRNELSLDGAINQYKDLYFSAKHLTS